MTECAPSQTEDRSGGQSAAGATGRALALCQRAVEAPPQDLAEQDQLFAALDRLIHGSPDLADHLLACTRFQAIHERLLQVRAAYEFERERALAEAIVEHGDTSPVGGFRSARMYADTHAFEHEALAGFRPRRVLFVGCGPFPISAIAWLADYSFATVTCLERREEAARLARQVADIYGCGGLEIRCADALDVEDFSAYDYVHVGTVVGVSASEKDRVIAHFLKHVPPRALLAFRTAVGPGRVIYPRVEPGKLGIGHHRLLPDPPQRTYSLILTDRPGKPSAGLSESA